VYNATLTRLATLLLTPHGAAADTVPLREEMKLLFSDPRDITNT
jgi:hypothetical protein